MSAPKATLLGFGAILLWSMLALFTEGSRPVPPLLLNALCFTVGGVIGLIWLVTKGNPKRLKAVPLGVYVFGTAGLFGYHFLYFSALRMAPPAQAGLIAYLWPLLIVLFSGLLPGESLRTGHVIGALIGLCGAAVILFADGIGAVDQAALPGYGLALLCALTWSGYSVFSRRLGDTPTESVAVFCVTTALLSALAHLALEPTIWPDDAGSWLSVIALGLGPVGLAFYVWDIGVKRGNIQLLGVASYAAPLLSTLILVMAGVAEPTLSLALAAALITGGAILAARASRH
ncbi:DMT family transporter [Cognatishimia sp. MH4019]|uniref:aromatic amino acid exporter YddG n=1 Tax=Cognatishimia sp. MH4019 TaxID=2854030 RepID=UPI001CD19F63|nr:EamA family transporter [Cognatishimia sp. MH4019]